MKSAIRLVAWLLIAAAALGCGKKNLTQPPPPPSNPPLETIWPSTDGLSWRYEIAARWWDDVPPRYYQSADSVPPAPSLSQLALLLGTQPIGATPATDTATFELRFNGTFTTSAGVTGQRLTETIIRPRPPSPSRQSAMSGLARGLPRGFLQDLARARPDLAAAFGLVRAFPSRALAPLDTVITSPGTTFLSGFCFRKTSEWIGSYNDVDTALAWKYLAKDLTPGSEFTHQLIPLLAPSVVLRARILSRQDIHTIAGHFPSAVVCLYVVDFGLTEAADDQGNPLGYLRTYTYGTVAYSDAVGPIASYERRLVNTGPGSLGLFDHTLSLSSRGTFVPHARLLRQD